MFWVFLIVYSVTLFKVFCMDDYSYCLCRPTSLLNGARSLMRLIHAQKWIKFSYIQFDLKIYYSEGPKSMFSLPKKTWNFFVLTTWFWTFNHYAPWNKKCKWTKLYFINSITFFWYSVWIHPHIQIHTFASLIFMVIDQDQSQVTYFKTD